MAGHCERCNTKLGHLKADDFPAYLTIVLVGHILVPMIFIFEDPLAPFSWWPIIMWPTLAGIIGLAALPVLKGCALAVLWRLDNEGALHADAVDDSRIG